MKSINIRTKSIIIGIIVAVLVALNLTIDEPQNAYALSCKQQANVLFDLTDCENRMIEIALNGDEDAVGSWLTNTQEGIACDRLNSEWEEWIKHCEVEK